MLTKLQLKALGYKTTNQVPRELWNEKISSLFGKCGRQNIDLGDEGQTYQEFLQIGARPPNEQGTGRFRFSQIKGLSFIIIPRKNSTKLSSKTIQTIVQILSTFTTLKTKYEKSNLIVSTKGIINTKQKLQYELQYSSSMIQVQPLLSLLIELKTPHHQTIALIQHQICEDSSDLQGRACGDGVAAISFKGKLVQRIGGLQTICWTLIHETLHTLGFDHCLAWKCLMNGVDDEEMWLCPACMRKLQSEIGVGVEEWVGRMTRVYEKYGMKKGANKGRRLLEGMNDDEDQ